MNIFELATFFIFIFILICFFIVLYRIASQHQDNQGLLNEKAKGINATIKVLSGIILLLIIPIGVLIGVGGAFPWYELYLLLFLYYFILLIIYLSYQQYINNQYLLSYIQLVQVCDIFIEELRIGNSLIQCMHKCYQTLNPPLKIYFQTVECQLQIGLNLYQALLRGRYSMPNLKYLDYFTLLIMIHEITESPIIHELIMLRAQLTELDDRLKNLTVSVAIGKYSALITSVLPLVGFMAIYYIAPDFTTPFLASKASPFIVGICTFLVFFGLILIFRLTKAPFIKIDGEKV